MAIGFMNNNTSTETRSSHDLVANHAAFEENYGEGGWGPGPVSRSTRRANAVHQMPAVYDPSSASALHVVRSAVVAVGRRPRTSTAQSEQISRTQRSDERFHGHHSGRPVDVPSAGSQDSWPAQDDFQTPHRSIVGGGGGGGGGGAYILSDRRTRFAWEPLAAGGAAEHDNRGHSSTAAVCPLVPSTRWDGGDSVSGRSGAKVLQGLSEGTPHQDYGNLEVKRFRSSAGRSSSVGRKHDEEARTMGWASNQRPCLPRRAGFEVGKSAWKMEQVLPSPDPVKARPRTSGAVADATDDAESSGNGQMAPPAARGIKRRVCSTGDINRSSSWAGVTTKNPTHREGRVPNQPGLSAGDYATADFPYRQWQEGCFQERGSHDSHETGGSAKKPRYRRLRDQRTLSAGHMDTLTDGVSNLGVASSGAAGDGSEDVGPVDTPGTHGCMREWFRDQTNVFSPSESLWSTPALGGDRRNGTGGAGSGGGHSGANNARRTIASRGVQPGSVIGGVGPFQSKKRGSGSISISMGILSVRTPVFPVEGSMAGVAMTSTPASAAVAAARRRHRRSTSTTTTTTTSRRAAAGCGAMDAKRVAWHGQGNVSLCGLPRASSSPLLGLMPQVGSKEASGFDAAAARSSFCCSSASRVDSVKGGGPAAGGVDAEEDDNSGDERAAHEELSAWLHSTDGWWISD